MHADLRMTEHYGAQDLQGIQNAYATFTAGVGNLERLGHEGNGEMDVDNAVQTLTEMTKSPSLSNQQREMLKIFTLELLRLLMR
jgi:hypothetical protein